MTAVHEVHCASSGKTFAVQIPEAEDSVKSLRQKLAGLAAIPVDDQIILYGPPFAPLDKRRSLSAHGLPSDNKSIFMYDRRMLASDAKAPPPVRLEPQEIPVPTTPAVDMSESTRALSQSTSPLLKALAEYDKQIGTSLLISQAYCNGAALRLKACEQCVAQQEIQSKAVQAAVTNLESHARQMNKRFESFRRKFSDAKLQHQHTLHSFDADLNQLLQIKLHAALQTKERQTLYDCVPVDRERQWAIECEKTLAHLSDKVETLSVLHSEVDSGVAQLSSTMPSPIISSLENAGTITSQQAVRRDQIASSRKIVSQRVEEITQQLQPFSAGSQVGSTSALEACRGLDEILAKTDALVPNIQLADDQLKAIMQECAKQKNNISNILFSSLRRISKLQGDIRNIGHMLSAYEEALQKQKTQFAELEHVRQLPAAYAAAQVEVMRRRVYGRRFNTQVESMVEELAKLRDVEVELRQGFLRRYGKHLPTTLIPGLAERPPHADIQLPAFDRLLPAIDALDENADDESVKSGSLDEHEEDEKGSSSIIIEAAPAGADSSKLKTRCDALQYQVCKLTAELTSLKSEETDRSQAQGLPSTVKTVAPKSTPTQSKNVAIASDSLKAVRRMADSPSSPHNLVKGITLLTALADAVETEDQPGSMSGSLISSLKDELDRLSTECEEAKRQAESVRHELANVTEKYNLAQANAAQFQKEAEATKTSLDAFERHKNRVEELNSSLQQQIKTLEESSRSSHAPQSSNEKNSKTISELRAELKDAQSKNYELLLNATTFEEDLGKKQSEADKLQTKIKTHVNLFEQLLKAASLAEETGGPLDFTIGAGCLKEAQVPAEVAKFGEVAQKVQSLWQENAQLRKNWQELNCNMEAISSSSANKIAFRSFAVNELALFLPTEAHGSESDVRVYLAFHLGCPHRYLSTESIRSIYQEQQRYPDYILGKILLVDEREATAQDNPYCLEKSTMFYVLTVEAYTPT